MINIAFLACARPPHSCAAKRFSWKATQDQSSLLGLLVATFSLIFTLFLLPPAAIAATNELNWRTDQNLVDAQIQAWDLHTLLSHLAERTGWQIYVDPDAQLTVSVAFRRLPPGEALGRLLGNLNYALLPQTNGPSKLLVFRNSVHEATQFVAPSPKKASVAKRTGSIPNELIVTLKPGSKIKIEDLARQLGAKIVGRIDGLNSYRLQFADEAAATNARSALESNSDVNAVDSNYSINIPARIEPLSLSSTMPLNLKPKNPPDPNQLVVGLIDTPIQSQAARIKDFLLPAVSVADDGQAAAASSTPTHGTSMAETILRGMSLSQQTAGGTSMRILPIDVYGNNESTSTFEVANGIYTAVKNGATLINLSLGGDNDSTFLHQVIQQAHEQGVMLVAAAGNVPTTAPVYPAAYPEVLATTAGDKNGTIAPYANRGSFIGAVAPGGSIVYFNNQAFLVSGTSAATAYITGVAAGMMANGAKSLTEVESAIRQNFSPKSLPAP